MSRWLVFLNVVAPLAVAGLVVYVVIPKGTWIHHDWWVDVRVTALTVDARTREPLAGVTVLALRLAEPAGAIAQRLELLRLGAPLPPAEAVASVSDEAGVVAFVKTTVYGETTEGDAVPRGPPPHFGVAAVVFDKPGYARVVVPASGATWTPEDGVDGVLDCGEVALRRTGP